MSWLLDLYGDLVTWAGVPQKQRKTLDIRGTGVVVADDPVKKCTRITFTAGAVDAASVLAALAAAAASVDINGQPLTVGSSIGMANGASFYTGQVSTTNATPTALFIVPLADNAVASIALRVVGRSGTDVAKFSRDIIVQNQAGIIADTGSVIGLDHDDIGVAATPVTATLSGGMLSILITGKAATSITWRVYAEILTLP